MAMANVPEATDGGFKVRAQRLGGYLAAMVMPNIGAFIAWGLITALFIPTGWLPDKQFAVLVDPMINILLPVLIGYTGGRMVHGQRGAVVGAIATVGVVVGSGIPMFLGAMVMGPLAAYVVKRVDEFTGRVTPSGFEMLVDNFTAGIVGAAGALFGIWGVGPVVRHATAAAGTGVEWLINHHLLPLASVLIEPAKVLFLNNAVNHGVLGPLGVAEASGHGKSILFMLESNPGPGFGVLLAYLLFGPRALRPSTPAAMIIQFLGGIHEIYFPYVLMKPRLILATIAGGAAGITIFMVTGVGLIATPAPGSIFAFIAETPRGDWIGVLAGVIVSGAVSFLVASLLLGFGAFAESRPAARHAGQEHLVVER
ncbi:PTS mannitol transporter subunit IICB [Actinoallomurus spadix]|uniref:PTS EIIC type-2 domain-containing protein n=1 Tax=Actinoallomurus spadix TaxID=79912 RepID=A0ABN0WXU0_9ACTN|nr:PTS mannitol transporter subunit IICB [Actinoallomurus spadix]MCO5989620.1 PTS mannitol transporter subunit IICB [Actinoallomurus spadix]